MGKPQSRLTDLTIHALPVISGSPDSDGVACGAGSAPPGGGSHGPLTIYGVKPEVDAVFSDDAYLIAEDAAAQSAARATGGGPRAVAAAARLLSTRGQ